VDQPGQWGNLLSTSRLIGLIVLICRLTLTASSLAQFTSSFEVTNQEGLPNGWTVVRGVATADKTVTRGGRVSLRVEAARSEDAAVRSPAIPLTIGKRYEISAWVCTEGLEVSDLGRSPIAEGAMISMASTPFDVHSEALGGTRGWTRVRLRFTATRPQDFIVLSAGSGGRFRGRAWFNAITLEEVSGEHNWPSRAAVQTFGPAYRYPVGGWIYLHIEGAPYDRGYQHGRLMAREIEQYVNRCALMLDWRSKERAWEMGRTAADALFLRGFDREILEEMKGIADGAKAAGAKWNRRDIDLVDIVTANTINDLWTLEGALPVTPTGLEGLGLRRPKYAEPRAEKPKHEHCNTFAATGPATRDSKMVIAHTTWFPLLLDEQTNVLIDIKPVAGHRLLMQSYPGGIESGTDYYQNDTGVVLTETTLRQSPFNLRGTSVAFRARKAIQYGTDIGQVVEYLKQENNGLYAAEWLIGDAKTNEIAMFELGTYRTKLYRSSQGEWFGGTAGFYWGCSNAKDLNVRLECQPDPKGLPAHLPFVPTPRDIKWQELYQQYKGSIDEHFAFLAFRTTPLVAPNAMDAKVTTADMASRMMCWVQFGKPNQREWVPSPWEKSNYPPITGLYSSGYRLIEAEPTPALQAILVDNERERLQKPKPSEPKPPSRKSYKDQRWEGWILPASDAELWLSAGSVAYYDVLSADDMEKELAADRAGFAAAALNGDDPLEKLSSNTTSSHWFDLARYKGALLFDALRRELGDDRFFTLMRDFFARNTTQTIGARSFIEAAEKAAGGPLAQFFMKWLKETGLPEQGGGAIYVASDIGRRLDSAILVYGTVLEAGANRYAAEQLQRRFLDSSESEVPIRKDFEVSEQELRAHDILFVGRPESNSALAAWRESLGLNYDGAEFRTGGTGHPSEYDSLILAASNPLDRTRMVLIIAGNSPLETVRVASAGFERTQYAVYRDGKVAESGFLK
jgi:hypothetical protein